jgi:hypothetical protein
MMNKDAQLWLNNYLVEMSLECPVCKNKPKTKEMCEDCMMKRSADMFIYVMHMM